MPLSQDLSDILLIYYLKKNSTLRHQINIITNHSKSIMIR